jgi:hypothetical protein
LCVSRFMNVLTRYSAEQRHVLQLRGDTSDLVIDDKEITIFLTSSSVFSEAHSALNILFHCKPPVITACYSMIISMFMSRQTRDC